MTDNSEIANRGEKLTGLQSFALASAFYRPLFFVVIVLSLVLYKDSPTWRLAGQILVGLFLGFDLGLRIWMEVQLRKEKMKRSTWATVLSFVGFAIMTIAFISFAFH